MPRTGVHAFLRTFVSAGLVLSLLTLPTFTQSSSATNPDCVPTAIAPNTNTRAYLFTSTTLCDWVVPAGWGSFTLLMMGGGGGGGGGSWAGTHGGGGGGGGAGGPLRIDKTATVGNRISIQVGAGGTAGAGAATQGGTTGTAGGNGSDSIFGGTEIAIGGFGGGGGSSDIGGAGGANGGPAATGILRSSFQNRVSGGSQNSGNAGGGSSANSTAPGLDATATTPGYGQPGSSYFPRTSLDGGGGGGGANQTTTFTARAASASGGSLNAAPIAGLANSGSGSGGGRGCGSSASTCINRDGLAGASGYILVFATPRVETDSRGQFMYFNVGNSITPPELRTTGTVGSITWRVSPALPAGLSLNSSTGVISGTFTNVVAGRQYILYASDSLGEFTNYGSLYMAVDKGSSTTPTFTGVDIVYNVPTALVASGGSGTGALTFSSTDPNCVLSGTRGETVTAQKATGTCSITVTKAGDANWYSASKSASFTLVKEASELSIAVSLSSPRKEGVAITITATVGAGQSGTVTFSASGSSIGNCGTSGAVTISGTSASCIWTPSASGSPFTLSATYSGDSNYRSATSNSITYTIYPSINLSYPSLSTTFGTGKTSTPTISGGTGSSSLWGWSVVKASDSSTVSGITISSSGVVTAASTLSAGTYAMRVDATDTVGITESSLFSIVVSPSGGASATVSPDKNSTTVGGIVQLRATVVSGATGTIAFKYGGTTISGCGTIAISSGEAICDWTTNTTTGSPFTVTAVYSGDSNFSTSTSAGRTVSVNAVGIFTYTSQNYVFGIAKNISVTTSGGTGSFSSWTVVNSSDNQSDYRVSINDSGQVTIAGNMPVGNYSFIVAATDEESVSGSGTIAFTITKSTPTVTLSARMIDGTQVTSGTLGRQVRLVVNLSTPAGGQATITGNSATLCTVFIFNGTGECWWVPSNASGAPYTISASYGGTTDANSGTSNQITNFNWNPAISISYANRSIETGKQATISPTLSGGTGLRSAWRWSISQTFTGYAIGGISISDSGVINIGPSVQPETYTMVIGASDLAGATEYANVTILIANQVSPQISLSSSSETVTVNSALSGFTITNGGSDVVSYSIDGALPAGISFDTSTGLLSGTPTETLTAELLTITASNFAGIDTATFTLTVSSSGGGGGATITISLTGGAITAAKGSAVTITATISVSGKVKFLANGKVIGGCASKSGSSSATCSWKPTVQGQSVALTAILNPTSNSYSNVRSAALNVGVGRRTGRR